MDAFVAAMDSPAGAAAVRRDLADGNRAGVQATPTILINGKKYQGALTAGALGPLIANELKGR